MKKFTLLIILGVLVITIAAGCGRQVFSGNRTGNDKQFIMDYSVLNCTKTHEMKLEEGANINVSIENKSGHVDILVTGENGEEIYKGNDAAPGKFSIKISKAGTYKFSVTGDNAKGSVSFIVAD